MSLLEHLSPLTTTPPRTSPNILTSASYPSLFCTCYRLSKMEQQLSTAALEALQPSKLDNQVFENFITYLTISRSNEEKSLTTHIASLHLLDHTAICYIARWLQSDALYP